LEVSGPDSVNENTGNTPYRATATFSDNSTLNVTSQATWSGDSPYASIDGGVLTTTEVTGNQPVTVTTTWSTGGVSRTGTKTVTIVDTTDTDHDGMPDWWEVKYGLNPSVNDAHSDLDGDGFTNLTEYRRGTDPSDPNSHPTKAMPWIPLLLED